MKRFELVKRQDHYGLYNEDGHKIAATIDGCNSKLSKENCDEIFGVVDEDKKNLYYYKQVMNSYETGGQLYTAYEKGFIEGFNKAMELNKDKLFGVKEVVELCKILLSNPFEKCGKTYQELTDNYIQSLQQPTEIEVEMIYDRDCYSSAGWCDKLTMSQCIMCTPVYPLKDENDCLILKKK